MLIRLRWRSLKRTRARIEFLRRAIPQGGIAAEIGVHKGRFTRCILNVTKPAKLHLIDLWYLAGKRWDWGRGNRSTVDGLIGSLRACEHELVRGVAVLHIGDDLELLATFPDRYFDWVYLDTTHEYEHTRKELELLQLKVKLDGVIAGDDWQTDPCHEHHGLCRAVREFMEREPYELVYADDDDKQWAIRRVQPLRAPSARPKTGA